MERLLDRSDEPLGVMSVGPLRVTAATVEPEVDQMLVRLGLLGDDQGGRRHRDQRPVRGIMRMHDYVPSRE